MLKKKLEMQLLNCYILENSSILSIVVSFEKGPVVKNMSSLHLFVFFLFCRSYQVTFYQWFWEIFYQELSPNALHYSYFYPIYFFN